MSLFVLSSKDGWVNIMYDGLDAVGIDQQVWGAGSPGLPGGAHCPLGGLGASPQGLFLASAFPGILGDDALGSVWPLR